MPHHSLLKMRAGAWLCALAALFVLAAPSANAAPVPAALRSRLLLGSVGAAVVNGRDAARQRYPWSVSLRIDTGRSGLAAQPHFCGGRCVGRACANRSGVLQCRAWRSGTSEPYAPP